MSVLLRCLVLADYIQVEIELLSYTDICTVAREVLQSDCDSEKWTMDVPQLSENEVS